MSSFPVAIYIAGQSVYLHGLLETIGIFIAFRYYLALRKRSGDAISSEHRIWIVIAATLGAVLGARTLGALENLPQWRESSHRLAYFWGNKTLVGGLLGGLAGVECIKKVIGERQRSGDLFVYPLLAGMIIGRVGCFSAGVFEETYGIPSRLPWAMDLGDGELRHPVVLYEIAFLLLLAAALRLLQRRAALESGALFKVFLMSYLAFRFLLDFIKPGWRPFFGLGSIQIACLAGLAYYGRYLMKPSLLVTDGNQK